MGFKTTITHETITLAFQTFFSTFDELAVADLNQGNLAAMSKSFKFPPTCLQTLQLTPSSSRT
eukprot:2602439-Amphidinium_carterae.1